ncbi:MAG: hypothetical protein JW893_04720 [Candidatus Omnitrophica bacterium]|nr:hypothetical protein [Candidatus Omnitrophota bacterium]
MNKPSVSGFMKVMVLLGIGIGLYISWGLIFTSDLPIWGILGVLNASAFLMIGWGIWNGNSWGLRLSWVLAVWVLGFGCFLLLYAWQFYLFGARSMEERIELVTVRNPQIVMIILSSIVWLMYSTREKVVDRFR